MENNTDTIIIYNTKGKCSSAFVNQKKKRKEKINIRGKGHGIFIAIVVLFHASSKLLLPLRNWKSFN